MISERYAEEKNMLAPPDIEPIKNFVSKALQSKARGDAANYNHIVQQLRVKDDPDLLWKLLIALSSSISLLTSRPDFYRDMIQAIHVYDWTLEPKISAAYSHLLGAIVSSNATFIVPAFQMLVKGFVGAHPPASGASSSSSVAADGGAAEAEAAAVQAAHAQRTVERHQHIHKAIAHLVALAPTAQSELFPVLMDHFPYKKQALQQQVDYVTALLRVCEYLPVLQYRVLDLVMGKCLEIDVEILIEDSGAAALAQKDLLADDEGDDDDGQIGSGAMGSRSIPPAPASRPNSRTSSPILVGSSRKNKGSAVPCIGIARKAVGASGAIVFNSAGGRIHRGSSQRIAEEEAGVSEMAEKLDAMLFACLSFIDVQCARSEESADRLFHQLLGLFQERILVVHRSKFVQFLLFHVTSKSSKYSYLFIRRLLQLLHNDLVSAVMRQSAIAYLASYLARAMFIPAEFVSDAVQELVLWSNDYVCSTDAAAAGYEGTDCGHEHVPDDSHVHISYAEAVAGGKRSSKTQAQMSVFASCRRAKVRPAASRGSSGDAESKSRDTSSSSASSLFSHSEAQTAAGASGLVLVPTNTHWVKMDGRTHRHRSQLINGPDDVQLLTAVDGTSTNGSTDQAEKTAPLRVSVLGKRQASSSPCVSYTSSPMAEAGANFLSSNAAVPPGHMRQVGRFGPAPSSTFVPTESCGNLAALLSSSVAVSEGATANSSPSVQSNSSQPPSPVAAGGCLRQTDLQKHETFYCCVQAAAYVACFHGTALLQDVNQRKDSLRRLWERVLSCSHAPLKYCLQSVRDEFLRLAVAVRFLKAPCLDAVTAMCSGGTGGGAGLGSLAASTSTAGTSPSTKSSAVNPANPNPLDSFFPFDPCLLQRITDRYVQDRVVYRTWEGIPGLDFDAEGGTDCMGESESAFVKGGASAPLAMRGRGGSSSSSGTSHLDSSSCSSDEEDEEEDVIGHMSDDGSVASNTRADWKRKWQLPRDQRSGSVATVTTCSASTSTVGSLPTRDAADRSVSLGCLGDVEDDEDLFSEPGPLDDDEDEDDACSVLSGDGSMAGSQTRRRRRRGSSIAMSCASISVSWTSVSGGGDRAGSMGSVGSAGRVKIPDRSGSVTGSSCDSGVDDSSSAASSLSEFSGPPSYLQQYSRLVGKDTSVSFSMQGLSSSAARSGDSRRAAGGRKNSGSGSNERSRAMNEAVSQENHRFADMRRQRGLSLGSNVSAGSW